MPAAAWVPRKRESRGIPIQQRRKICVLRRLELQRKGGFKSGIQLFNGVRRLGIIGDGK